MDRLYSSVFERDVPFKTKIDKRGSREKESAARDAFHTQSTCDDGHANITRYNAAVGCAHNEREPFSISYRALARL